MNSTNHTLFVLLFVSLATMPVIAQNSNPTQKTEKKTVKEESREDGLVKLNTNRNLNFKINIDEKALETYIELAVQNAMRSVETALEALEIHIEPIEINLKDLNLNLDRIDINIPRFDIEPIGIDLDDMDEDFDMDIDMNDNWDSDDEDRVIILKQDSDFKKSGNDDKLKENDKQKAKADKEMKQSKDKATKEEKDKTKGLKKIN